MSRRPLLVALPKRPRVLHLAFGSLLVARRSRARFPFPPLLPLLTLEAPRLGVIFVGNAVAPPVLHAVREVVQLEREPRRVRRLRFGERGFQIGVPGVAVGLRGLHLQAVRLLDGVLKLPLAVALARVAVADKREGEARERGERPRAHPRD
eukprot:416132-Prorocentrum_minimum.AAC.3